MFFLLVRFLVHILAQSEKNFLDWAAEQIYDIPRYYYFASLINELHFE